MASHLIALTADGGVPLFTRRVGDIKALPFSIIGTLNGVHLFSRLRGSELKSAITSEEKILWRTYQDCIVLIVISSKDVGSDCHLANLLDNIFACLIMLVGLDSILNQSNIERLKRELKICYPLIDKMLSRMDHEYDNTGDLTQAVDCLLSYETPALQGYMEKFLEIADSSYGCLLIQGKIAVASKKWWTFTQQELVLISLLVNSLPKSTSRDVSIYLPQSCPQVCNRLLTLQLIQGVELCVLCCDTPSLSYLEEEAIKIWKGCFELLKMTTSLHPRNFPSNIILDKNILGVLLIHTEYKQSMCTVQPVYDENVCNKSRKPDDLLVRQEALRTLYSLAIGTFIDDEKPNLDSKIHSDNSDFEFNFSVSRSKCQAQEMYLCTEEHKCFVIKANPFQLFLIFNNSIPIYALKSISYKTMKSLTVKKLFTQ